MNTKHTAGQWTASKTINDFAIYSDTNDSKDIASVYQSSRSIPIEEAEANAKLIAAAPELLKALQNMVNLSYDTARPTKADKHYNMDLAITAIQKATT